MKTNFTFFLAFLANSSSIFSLRAIRRSTSPSTQFFYSFVTFFIFVFHYNYLLPCCSIFWNGNRLRIFGKSKSPSTCENWFLNPPFSTTPSDSTPLHALGKAKNALLLAITLRKSTKPTMSTLGLVKNGKACVLSTMSLIQHFFHSHKI